MKIDDKVRILEHHQGVDEIDATPPAGFEPPPPPSPLAGDPGAEHDGDGARDG